jgi:hypothetical protein
MAGEVIVFAKADVKGVTKGILADKKGLVSSALPIDTIKNNLDNFLASLNEMLPSVDKAKQGYGLDSFEVAVSIDAKGQVGFLGTGAEVGGSATLTLTFKKA